MHLHTFNLAFPSAALPASGSLGIISARYIKAPLCPGTHRSGAKVMVEKWILQIWMLEAGAFINGYFKFSPLEYL
jgi:hypothetical protein